MNPENSTVYLFLGTAYYALKQYDKAIKNFSKAIELNKDHPYLIYICYLGIMEECIIDGKPTQFNHWLKRFETDISENKLSKSYLITKFYLVLVNKCITNKPKADIEKRLDALLRDKGEVESNVFFDLTDELMRNSKNNLTPEQIKYIKNLTNKIKAVFAMAKH